MKIKKTSLFKMKLLLDQNISFKIIKNLEGLFTEIIHVGRLGLGQTDDGMIWQFAYVNEYIMVTFDSYFAERNLISGNPIKIVQLMFKDTSTDNIAKKILDNYENIKNFYYNDEYSCLQIL
ncbi:MAG: hypothetical protein EAZ85_01015 [Bacteroidetes bacterium]|nr:MAG: hypothetical protein EAZ85_01015 [Bacteroidota bacterium]TAG88216.1 MAG: hypothetical protein EAZ20_09040 [Bacteroidota bacterium]